MNSKTAKKTAFCLFVCIKIKNHTKNDDKKAVVDHFVKLDSHNCSKPMMIQLQEFLSEKYYKVKKLFKTLKTIQKEMTKKAHISQLLRTRRSSILASGHQKHHKVMRRRRPETLLFQLRNSDVGK